MSLRSLPSLLLRDPTLVAAVEGAQPVLTVPAVALSFFVAALSSAATRKPLLVVTPTASDAERLAHDLRALVQPNEVELFPAWDTLPFERVSPEVQTMGQRLRLLWRLGAGDHDGHPAGASGAAQAPTGPVGDERQIPAIVIAPMRSVLQILPPNLGAATPITVAAGDRVDQHDLVARLVEMGYRREYQVEHVGEVAVRGGIVDVFPSTAEMPVRIDLWGDEVDRLTSFDPSDQRSVETIGNAVIFGCRELVSTEALRDRATALVGSEPWGRAHWDRLADGQSFDGMESWLPWLNDDPSLLPDFLGDEAQVIVVEPRRARDRAAELADDEAALAQALAQTWGADHRTDSEEPGSSANGAEDDDSNSPFPRLHVSFDRLFARCRAPVMSVVSVPEGPDTPELAARGWTSAPGDRSELVLQLSRLVNDGFSVTVCVSSEGGAKRMVDLLAQEGAVAAFGSDDAVLALPGLHVAVSELDQGFVVSGAKVAVLTEQDMTGRRRAHRAPKARARATDGFFDDLAPGDYVVHRQHGVAKYTGMVTRTVNGASRDYLLLEYRGDDKLYIPTDQIDSLTPYSGGESPTLNKLGGNDWQRTRAKARAAVEQIARELVQLYRARLVVTGHAFSPDTPWQLEVEDAFGFVETPDQLKAIEEVKVDMETPTPMDRLVCGDVGFGKTEVAVRAAFKAVQDGKQVAILVPTTLLAQQHMQTFSDRYRSMPIKVAMLSRFLTPPQAKEVIAGLADGSIDVVIGTHRLLTAGIKFKDLGLLVVDEEQRFGVSHKEAVKAMATGVDVLTLTASPIPRTLEMALTGIRDLSLINTPPMARQPILTYVGEFEEAAVVEAIRRELLREGQVFYVHNWVQNIDSVAERLRFLVPEARVAVAHGQMDEGTLEQVVVDFWERRFDVLVCTTIIESGIDMPTVNTLVVDRADRLGLGQLHQLRGRVGRAGQRAYAYLLHPRDKVLSEAAYERLRTIGEHTELGSGFKIAMRDLEIRGAGNLLGRDQSGHIAAVGYDLYVQLVAEAVAELKGEPIRQPIEISIDVPSDAHLPASYVEREDLRLEAYRRLAQVATHEEVDDIRSEWVDRFGPPPEPAEGLLAVARLRVECIRTGVTEVTVTPLRVGQTGPGSRLATSFGPRPLVARISPLQLQMSSQVRLKRLHPDAIWKETATQLIIGISGSEDPAVQVASILRDLVPPESG
ncbi:MAG: transcription-repair coupling factor [Acidimicrobiales bacterium]